MSRQAAKSIGRIQGATAAPNVVIAAGKVGSYWRNVVAKIRERYQPAVCGARW